MISQIERDRQGFLLQINNQGRRLERISPADASELNVQLRKVVAWLTARETKNPRGPKGK